MKKSNYHKSEEIPPNVFLSSCEEMKDEEECSKPIENFKDSYIETENSDKNFSFSSLDFVSCDWKIVAKDFAKNEVCGSFPKMEKYQELKVYPLMDFKKNVDSEFSFDMDMDEGDVRRQKVLNQNYAQDFTTVTESLFGEKKKDRISDEETVKSNRKVDLGFKAVSNPEMEISVIKEDSEKSVRDTFRSRKVKQELGELGFLFSSDMSQKEGEMVREKQAELVQTELAEGWKEGNNGMDMDNLLIDGLFGHAKTNQDGSSGYEEEGESSVNFDKEDESVTMRPLFESIRSEVSAEMTLKPLFATEIMESSIKEEEEMPPKVIKIYEEPEERIGSSLRKFEMPRTPRSPSIAEFSSSENNQERDNKSKWNENKLDEPRFKVPVNLRSRKASEEDELKPHNIEEVKIRLLSRRSSTSINKAKPIVINEDEDNLAKKIINPKPSKKTKDHEVQDFLKEYGSEVFNLKSKTGYKKLRGLYRGGKLKKTNDISELIAGRTVCSQACLKVFGNMHFKAVQKNLSGGEAKKKKIYGKFKALKNKFFKSKLKEKSMISSSKSIRSRTPRMSKAQFLEKGRKTLYDIEQENFELGKQLEKPNKEKLKKFLKTSYITDTYGELYSLKRSICDDSLQPLLSCFKQNKSAFDCLGPGMTLYFNFLKLTMAFFFVCCLLTIPLQMTNIKFYKFSKNASLKPEGMPESTGLYSFLTSTTLAVSNTPNFRELHLTIRIYMR